MQFSIVPIWSMIRMSCQSFKPLSLAGLLNPHCIEKIYNFQLHETILHCKNKIIINTHKRNRVKISVCGIFFTRSIFMPALQEH